MGTTLDRYEAQMPGNVNMIRVSDFKIRDVGYSSEHKTLYIHYKDDSLVAYENVGEDFFKLIMRSGNIGHNLDVVKDIYHSRKIV